MAVSVGSATTSPLLSWQNMLQAGNVGGTKGKPSSDPLADLLNAGTGDQSSGATSSPSGSGAPSAPFGKDMMAQLIALQQQASESGTANTDDTGSTKLFAKLDSDGNGSISKSELKAASEKHGISADISSAVFDKIDANGDGAISQDELAKADKPGADGHAHGAGGPGGGDNEDGDGTKTTTTVNADGSVTTTVTYKDGSTNSTTSAPGVVDNDVMQTNNDKAKKPVADGGIDLFRQLAELQKQLMSTAASTLSTVI